MTLLLAGDIGGTKTILRLVKASEGGELHTLYEALYSSRNFPDLLSVTQQFLADAAQKLGEVPNPEKACFAIAGPVVDNTSVLTNLGWTIDTRSLEQELKIAPIHLINDFAAVGYGVMGLSESDLHPLQAGHFQPDAPIAVIGAGTGLGEGFLIRQGDTYQVFSTEGGHTEFAPRSELEFHFLKYMLDKHNIERVSYDRIVSGQGIIAIYQFLRDRQVAQESPEVGEVVRTWEQETGRTEKSVDPAAAISNAAMAKRDRLSEETMKMFVDIYGAEAGNFALKLLPYGGLYIAGGIAAKIMPLMQEGTFMQAFSHKGRVSPLLARVPVQVVLNPRVGLIGAALCAARL